MIRQEQDGAAGDGLWRGNPPKVDLKIPPSTDVDSWTVTAPGSDLNTPTVPPPADSPLSSVEALSTCCSHDPIPSPFEATPSVEPILQPGLFGRALKEVGTTHAQSLNRWSTKLDLSPSAEVAVVAATTAVVTAGLYLSPAKALGLIGSGVILQAMSHKYNVHSRAQGVVGASIFTAHLAIIGAWEGVLSSFVGITRNVMQSMIPDDATKVRGASAALGLAGSIAIFSALTDIIPIAKVSNLPLLASCFSSISGAFSKRYSWASRLCGLISIGATMPYYALEGSMFSQTLGVLLFLNLARSILKHDISRSQAKEPIY